MAAEPHPQQQLQEGDYGVENVAISIGRRRLTDDGLLILTEGNVFLLIAGEEPVEERIIDAAPAAEIDVSKPSIGMGMLLKMAIGDTTYLVSPESIERGAFVTPKKIKRARAAVAEFETAFDAAR